ncbi:hypothetical protein [Maricaulis sp. CAU 1757]
MSRPPDSGEPGMWFEIDIDSTAGLITWRVHGRFKLSEVKAGYEAVLAHADWNPDYDQLTVVEEDTRMDTVTLDSIRDFSASQEQAQLATRRHGRARSAIVFRQPQQFALLKSYEFNFSGRGRVEQRVFASEAEARRWLSQRER